MEVNVCEPVVTFSHRGGRSITLKGCDESGRHSQLGGDYSYGWQGILACGNL